MKNRTFKSSEHINVYIILLYQPPLLDYVRCKSAITFIWRCFRDELHQILFSLVPPGKHKCSFEIKACCFVSFKEIGLHLNVRISMRIHGEQITMK